MSKKYPSIAAIVLLFLLFLTGCSDKKDNARAVHIDESKTTEKTSISTTDTSESQATENMAPFAVDTTQFSNPATFNLHGVNVPRSITVENNGGTIVFKGRALNTEDVFAAQVTTIPTKEIRVSSQDGSGIRTVKANTQITLTQHLSGTGGQDRNNVMYLINNKNGGLSLLTPNYAGNVEPGQTDVMLEAVQ